MTISNNIEEEYFTIPSISSSGKVSFEKILVVGSPYFDTHNFIERSFEPYTIKDRKCKICGTILEYWIDGQHNDWYTISPLNNMFTCSEILMQEILK